MFKESTTELPLHVFSRGSLLGLGTGCVIASYGCSEELSSKLKQQTPFNHINVILGKNSVAYYSVTLCSHVYT